MSKLKDAIIKVTNTNPYENLPIIAGKCGQNVYKLVVEAEKADREIDLLHECITDLYNLDAALPIIRKYLDKIKLQSEQKTAEEMTVQEFSMLPLQAGLQVETPDGILKN